ncbi:hypothetical protein KM043_006842 [Ampulex compressa]|nr:hypothetical protein KM043_006842 [Ampulex compressa]
MLETLVVLTVLNCFFMFSSTITTCALWWQYRSNQHCFKKTPSSQVSKNNVKASKSNCICRAVRKGGKSRVEDVSIVGTYKSNTTANQEQKKKIGRKQKSRTNLKYLSQYKNQRDNVASRDKKSMRDMDQATKTSEASQTANDTKPAVLMEYSTVQKVVQLVDNDSDLATAQMAINNLVAKKNVENRKTNLAIKYKSEEDTNENIENP